MSIDASEAAVGPARRTTPAGNAAPAVRRERARKAIATRYGHDTREIDRDLAAANIEAYVARVVAAAPPLSPAQLERIGSLLRSPTDTRGK